MTYNRFALYNVLFPQLTESWGLRIKAQLNYLEELNAAWGAGLDDPLDAAAALLMETYEQEGAVTKASALKIESILQPASGPAKSVTVFCIGHAHIDMNWMWRYDETAIITVDTFRTMLALMREYPGFTFAQSQASVYQIAERYAPELLPEIIARIREGRWEVTASHWVETDKNMPGGESLTRHLLYTRQYLKKLLGLEDGQFLIDFKPDTFGHGANVPEILASGGVKYMYHCRGYDGHSLYRWRAPSGREVTVFRDSTWYNGAIDPDTFRYIPAFCAKNKVDRVLHVYGVGNHGGGATRRDIERILEYDRWPCMPKITFGRYIDFFRYIDTLDLPVVDHELNFVFDGCYTSQSRIKKANRIAEAALGEAEYYNAMSNLLDAYPYDAGKFGEYWQNTLFNHFHDILPGSGTIETREHALGLFQETMAGAGTRLSAAVRGLSEKINTAALLQDTAISKDSTSEGAGAGYNVGYEAGTEGFNYTASSATGGMKRLFILFNPTQTVLDTIHTITVWDWEGDIQKIKITDEAGLTLEHELRDTEPQIFWGHCCFRVYVDCAIPPFGYRTVLLQEDAVFNPAGIVKDPRTDKAPPFILENEHVAAIFDRVTFGLTHFTDKKTGRQYIGGGQGGASFRYIEEDTSSGMTSWRVGRYATDTPVPTGNVMMPGAKYTADAEYGPIKAVTGSLVRRFSYTVPVKSSTLSVTVSLGKNDRHLKYAITCDWREIGTAITCVPQLAFRVPLADDSPDRLFVHDNAFGVIERSGVDNDVPAHSFSFAPVDSGTRGIMLSSDSKYGFRCCSDSMSLTLIRSSYDPDPTPEIYNHAFTINVGIIEEATPKTLPEASLKQTRTVSAVACASQVGELPPSGQFMTLQGDGAVVSSVKGAEDGSGLIVRLHDISGADNAVTLVFSRGISTAAYVDAHENVLDSVLPKIDKKTVTLNCRAYGVMAVKVNF